jgi:hypothetical protein
VNGQPLLALGFDRFASAVGKIQTSKAMHAIGKAIPPAIPPNKSFAIKNSQSEIGKCD